MQFPYSSPPLDILFILGSQPKDEPKLPLFYESETGSWPSWEVCFGPFLAVTGDKHGQAHGSAGLHITQFWEAAKRQQVSTLPRRE